MKNPELPQNLESEKKYKWIIIEDNKGLKHPICPDCQKGKHNHPLNSQELKKEGRADCKNLGKVNGKLYQCHCGHGGEYKNGKWVSWEDENNF